jgi:hypothetical protein
LHELGAKPDYLLPAARQLAQLANRRRRHIQSHDAVAPQYVR